MRPTLPTALLSQIVHHLANDIYLKKEPLLLNLCLASKAFLRLARAVLYRDLRLNFQLPDAPDADASIYFRKKGHIVGGPSTDMWDTVQKWPHLAQHVRTVVVESPCDSLAPGVQQLKNVIRASMRQLFDLCPSVEGWRLQYCPTAIVDVIMEVIDERRPPLRRLVAPYVPTVVGLLDRLPHLVNLTLQAPISPWSNDHSFDDSAPLSLPALHLQQLHLSGCYLPLIPFPSNLAIALVSSSSASLRALTVHAEEFVLLAPHIARCRALTSLGVQEVTEDDLMGRKDESELAGAWEVAFPPSASDSESKEEGCLTHLKLVQQTSSSRSDRALSAQFICRLPLSLLSIHFVHFDELSSRAVELLLEGRPMLRRVGIASDCEDWVEEMLTRAEGSGWRRDDGRGFVKWVER